MPRLALRISKLPRSEIEAHQPQFPYFLPMTPYGLNTGEIEALSSYLCRQAESVMELAHAYSRKLLYEYVDSDKLPKTEKMPARGLQCCNSFGMSASRYIEAITEASSGSIDAEQLTFKSLEFLNTANARGLQREHRSWCNECWINDISSERTPYIRLYWLFQNTEVCAIHQCKLTEYCPICGEIQTQYPSFPRQWICDKCGNELYVKDLQIEPHDFNTQASWVSRALFQLIERVTKQKLNIKPNQVKRSLTRLLNTYQLSPLDFSHRINMDPKIIDRILTGTNRTYFPTLLDLCYRLDIPIDQFLFDRDILTSPDIWRTLPQETFFTNSKLTDRKKRKIERLLNKIVKDNPNPPVSVSHIAQKFDNVSYTSIYYNFPRQYRILRERRKKWERNERRITHTLRLERMCLGAFNLAKIGVYPSDRKLRDLGLVLPSDLRRDDVKEVLRAIQSVYSGLDPG